MYIPTTRMNRCNVPTGSVLPRAAPKQLDFSKTNVPKLVHWSFMFFVFTIPFETASLDFTSQSLSLAKISGLLFFASYFWYYNPLFSYGGKSLHPPTAFWWFLGYVLVYALNGFFIDGVFISQFMGRLFTLIQLIVLFWIASKVWENQRVARHCVLTFALSCCVLALAMILDLPGFSTTMTVNVSIERETALGFDANVLATLMALATAMLVGLRLNPVYKKFTSKAGLLLLTLPLLVVIIKTGSRTGVGVFVIGFIVYLVPYWRSSRKATAYALAGLGIAAMSYMVLQNPDMLARWQQTFSEGSLSGREKIAPETLIMIQEKPLLGWKPVEFQHELGLRLGRIFETRDAHNLYLHLLLEVGILGALPFLTGLYLCGCAAWKGRAGHLGLMPLACLLVLLAANLSLTQLQSKSLWLILALALDAQVIAVRERQWRMMLAPRITRSTP